LGSDRYRDYAGDIVASGKHLVALINDILDTSKIEAGKYELREEHCRLEDVIGACVRMMADRAAAARLDLASRTEENLPTLRADARAMRQIVINLLSNAVKFTPAGGRVEVIAGRGDHGGARIQVLDTGVGISPDGLKTAFQAFAQIDDTYTRQAGGTGLGLYLTRSLAELHGGTVRIDSTVGVGTAVTVDLPSARWILVDAASAAGGA
jgi:signal transduction histidine kinase